MKRATSEKLTREIAILKREEGKPRRFRMAAYTGVQFSRWWGQMVIDLAGIEEIPERGLPMLLDHSPSPVGVADTMEIGDEGLVLEGYFLDTDAAKHVQQLADQGFPWTASVGVKCLAETEIKDGSAISVNGQEVKGPAYCWAKSRLYETSFITAGPADDATGVEVMMGAEQLGAEKTAEKPVTTVDREALKIEILKEHDAKRRSYVDSLVAAGAKKVKARAWFDDGLTIEQAFAKHAEVMAAERDEALAKVQHLEKNGKIDGRDAQRVRAGISRGYDPEPAKDSERKNRILEKLEKGRIDKLSKRERVLVEEKLAAFREWSQRNDDGLLMRSVFPRHQGGHELLHAVMTAEDNTAIKLRCAEKGLPIAPPYWIGDNFIEKLADALTDGTEKFAGKGFVEQLAGTWGRNGHAYSSMVVKGYLAALFKPLEDDVGKGWAQRVGITIPSNQEMETYRFLGNPPQIRKWVGNRQTKFMPPFQHVIANDTYEGTVDFPVNDFRFDKSGHIMLRMGELGIRARQHWDVLGTQVLLNNPTAYDGVTLLSTASSHTQGGGFTFKNSLVAADVPALSVSNPTNPTQQEMVAAIMGVIQYFFTYQDQTGSPLNGDAKKFIVMVPPNLWGAAMTAVRAARLNFGQDNPLMEQDYSVEVVPNGWLVTGFVGSATNTNFFYVFRVDSQFRPIVFQDVTGWEAQMLGPGSDTTVMKDRIIYGVRAVRGSGAGEPAHAIKATLS